MNRALSFALVVLIIAGVSVGAGALLTYRLYQRELTRVEQELRDEVEHEAALLAPLARDDRAAGERRVRERAKATKAGHLLRVVRRETDSIRCIAGGLSLEFSSTRAEPMRRALRGYTGVVIAPDADGQQALHAYGPVADVGWGVVVSAPLHVLRRPFLEAWAWAGSMLLVGVALAATLVRSLAGFADRGLREREALARSLLEAAPDAVITIDCEGRIAGFNYEAQRLFGYASAEVIGRNVSVLMPSPERERHDGYLAAYLATGKRKAIGTRREVTAQRRDGTSFPLEIAITESTILGRRLFTAMARDLIEGRQTDQQIKDLAKFPSESPEPVFRALPDGTVLYANLACDPLLHDWNTKVGGRLPRYWRDILVDVLETGRVREIEHRSGSRSFNLRCVAITGSGYVNVYGTDVTRGKEIARELQRAKEEAEAASRLKTEFLANMSHEIRTPMTAILGYADMLADNHHGLEERGEYVETIRRNGVHLLAVINDILDLSKIESGRMATESVSFNPWDIVCEAVSLVRPTADEKGLALELESSGPIPVMISSDPVRLRQILINLLGNALKFTLRGGVRMCVRMASDARDDSARLRFDVVDTGIGMSSEELGRLFQPFVQADSSTTREYGGTGLGLAISKRLAEWLGGDIRVTSRTREGSTFSLTIRTGPLDPAHMVTTPRTAPREVTSADEEQALGLVGGRVLLAEDGRDNQRLIRAILRRVGLEVDIAENGRTALECALAAWREDDPYDVILMDMQMPELDGYNATQKLREAGYPGPVIALTAHAMAGDREKCLAAGCNDFATKPIDRRRLAQLIEHYIRKESD